MSKQLDFLFEHYMFCLLALALIGLTIMGVGDLTHVAWIGIILCAAGFFRRPGTVDWMIMGPLLGYLVIGAISAYAASGDASYTYTAPQAVYPVLYVLMSGLEGKEQAWLRRFCAIWTAVVAAHGIAVFLTAVVNGGAGRLRGMLDNPNALGIFLVVGWFGLTAWGPGERGFWAVLARRLEPVVLAALALTLSMGSFLSMAVGIAVRIAGWSKETGWRDAMERGARTLAKCAVGVGTGLLMYITGRAAGLEWLSFGLVLWLAALALFWDAFDRFLETRRWLPWALCAIGALAAVLAVYLRPRAGATFLERLDMMRNGLSYLTDSPLLGVGPYRWRLLNMTDAGPYYGTWYIHNVPLHIGVETGLAAMAAVVLLAARALRKKGRNVSGLAAFLVNNLIDTGFFYLGTTAMAMFTAAEPDREERRLSPAAHKLFCGGFCLVFIGYSVFGWTAR